jgi:hypothetical protein
VIALLQAMSNGYHKIVTATLLAAVCVVLQANTFRKTTLRSTYTQCNCCRKQSHNQVAVHAAAAATVHPLLLQAKMMGKAASNASYIQDHPRSANRVKLLQVR